MDTHRVLQIWDFQSLTFMYHILATLGKLSGPAIASDGSSVIDIVDWHARLDTVNTCVKKCRRSGYEQ